MHSPSKSTSKGTRVSPLRPDSSSTVESFSSAKPFAPSSPSPLSPVHVLRVSQDPLRKSSSSSNGGTSHDSLGKGKDFETMLASGETWKVSETAQVARYDPHDTLQSIKHQDSSSSMSSKRRQINGKFESDKVDKDMQITPMMNTLHSFSSNVSTPPALPVKSADRSPTSATTSNARLLNPTLSKELPVHPHHRNSGGHIESSSPEQPNTQRLNLNMSPTMRTKLDSPKLGPSLQNRSPPSFASSSASGLAATLRSKTFNSTNVESSPAISTSSQPSFTGLLSKSDPIASEVHHMHLEGGPRTATFSEKSDSTLKQRLKKTGGFLKRLGGGSNAEKGILSPPRTPKIVRRPSQSSIGSEGGNSIANSTKSAPGEYQFRWGKDPKVPVPSIPNRFKGNSAERRIQDKTISPSGLPTSNSVESQASSSSKRERGNRTPSATSDFAGSATTDIRHVLKAWENEMDATLQQSGRDLETKTKIEKPSEHWTPSPRLPEYKLNRKGSFMDEGETDLLQMSSPDTYRGASSYDSQFLLPHQPQRSASLGIGLPSTISSQAILIHSDPITSTPTFSSSPRRDVGHDTYSKYRHAREDNKSFASAKSYETANDRPSFFIQHADRNEPSMTETIAPLSGASSKDMDNKKESEEVEEEETDPEKSIRLITHGSVDTDEGTLVGQKSDLISTPALTVIDEIRKRHLKDKTVTQNDFLHRSPSPAVEHVKTSGSSDVSTVDQSIEVAAKEAALKCWNEDEMFKRKEKIAEWLGGTSLIQQMARKYYMDQLDLANLRIEAAFRKLCDKLFLRAETQQVDRILFSFSQRYFDCNFQTILANPDIIHALVFSVLLLNTDLHVAEIQDRMTRNQFVRNTLAAIMENSEIIAFQTWANEGSNREEDVKSQSSLNVSSDAADTSEMHVSAPNIQFSSRLTPTRRTSHDAFSISGSDATKLQLNSSSTTFNNAWELELEILLKDIYIAVKTDQIRLPITDTDTLSSLRPRKPLRVGSDRVNALKRGSIRGIQGLLGANSLGVRSDENLSGSRSSLNSTQKSFSDYNANNSTTSTSLTSGSIYGPPPALGFANTLSHSIIKEAKDEEDCRSIDSINDDLTDDELALMGPPWAKEGMLTRKHYWEAPLKRAKDKSWTDCFVVVQKGMFSMFRFGDTNSSGNGNVDKSAANLTVGIGGGNWLSNATFLGEYPLAHTLANSLPPPGYNRSRPHVFALTLPNGNVFFFQTGHEELVQEWVSTCNYWAARQSREPLAGGVSNMEYGWNRVLPSDDRDDAEDDNMTVQSHTESIGQTRPSLQNTTSDSRSIRSGKSSRSLRRRVTNNRIFQSWQSGADRMSASGFSSPAPSSYQGSPSIFSTPDRPVYINEWRAPAPPIVSSTLSEEDQLEACKRHKARVEIELTLHNSLRQPMLDYFATCSPSMPASNVSKAISNFDRKASYLLSDLTKFTLYTATLASANKLKMERRDAKQINRMMLKADEDLSRVRVKDEEERGSPFKA